MELQLQQVAATEELAQLRRELQVSRRQLQRAENDSSDGNPREDSYHANTEVMSRASLLRNSYPDNLLFERKATVVISPNKMQIELCVKVIARESVAVKSLIYLSLVRHVTARCMFTDAACFVLPARQVDTLRNQLSQVTRQLGENKSRAADLSSQLERLQVRRAYNARYLRSLAV